MKSSLNVSDGNFLKEFNLLEVDNLLKERKISKAKYALLSHYKARSAPDWPLFPSRISDVYELSDEELFKQADLLLSHRFLLHNEPEICFGKKIEWKFNPTTDPKARWAQDLNRHCWLSVLGVAYQKCEDKRYAQEFVNLIADWVEKNPPPLRKNEKDIVWTLMGVGMRCLIWTSAFGIFIRSKIFSDKTLFLMLRSIFDHAQYLSLFQTKNNHLLRESNGLASIGVYFPEFHKATHWRELAFERLEKALIQQVNHDGSHFELSTGYQWLAIDEYRGTLDLLRASQTKFCRADLSKRLVKMYRLLGLICRPDGSMPQLNDGFMDSNELQLRKLAFAGSEFGCPNIEYIGTNGDKGLPPAETSVAFEDAGLFVMRSDWSRDARYLIFDSGPFGGPHGHEDKLSFEVFAYGHAFIVDPGAYTYNTADPFRNFFVSSRSHNTLVVEGKSQIRRLNRKNLNPNLCNVKTAQWISCKSFDYVKSDYSNGYGDYRFWRHKKTKKNDNITNGVVHTRSILFVKPDYWLMIDKVQSLSPFNYEILFHAAPGIKAVIKQNKHVNLFSDNAFLSLIPLSQNQIDVEHIMGGDNPIQGWCSNGRRNHKAPSPTIIFKLSSLKTAIISTLMYPGKNDQKTNLLSFKQEEVKDCKEDYRYLVTTSNKRDLITFSNDPMLGQAKTTKPNGLIEIQRTNI